MSRVIKFRAWNKLSSEMSHSGQWPSIDEYGSLDAFFTEEDHVAFMQYIGIKDSTGAEIFEGDILTFNNNHMPKDEPLLLGRVLYDAGTATYRCACSMDPDVLGGALFESCDDGMCESWNLTIIGNIHEHPELVGAE